MTNLLEFLFDGGLAVLLIVTIGYCSRLSRRIRLLQDSRGELAGMITQFDQATNRAMTSLAELQTVSKRIADALQLKIDKANFLADDIAFLIEKSSKLVLQLEQAKAALPAEPPPSPKPKPFVSQPYSQTATTPAKPKSALWPPPSSPVEIPASTSTTSIASLEALLNSLSASPPPPSNPKPPAVAPLTQGLRTGAERELLEALKSGR